MPYSGKVLGKRAFIIYLCLIVVAIVVLALRLPWEQCARSILGYYEDVSIIFLILSIFLIPFRLYAVWHKELAKTQSVLFLGPGIDIALDTLYDAARFYSGLFLFYTVFEARANGLSLDPLLILLLVGGVLVYQSANDLLKLILEIFRLREVEKITRV